MKNYFETSDKISKDGATVKDLETPEAGKFYKRGLGLKKEVQTLLKRDYYSQLVEYLRANDYRLQAEGLTFHLAREFGFCYGVDRAVDYAYQTREKFPDRRVFLTGEIIHNPHVNNRLIEMGVQFLSGQYSNGTTIDDLQPDDVVILPAFGVSVDEFKRLRATNCVLVDTTCGSVLNVWKRVDHYGQKGYTALIHGKYYHEETIATSSQALKYPGGKYLVVLNMEEAERVCDYIVHGGDKQAFMDYFAKAVSPAFDPDRDLKKIGVANQTTMLSSESLAIAEKVKQAMARRYGEAYLTEHFLSFDTICSATQDRQDAILELVQKQPLDLMIIIGGYNSSNTNHLAVMASQYTTAYHIDDPSSILSGGRIRHKKVGAPDVVVSEAWLPEGELEIGITAGASTPNNKIGEAVERILAFRGVTLEDVLN